MQQQHSFFAVAELLPMDCGFSEALFVFHMSGTKD
jgi:hypothetical protein